MSVRLVPLTRRLGDNVLMGALFASALTLRPQLVGVGPILPAIQSDLSLSHAAAGLLTTIPVLGMGLLAPLAPIVARRSGTRGAIGASIALIGVSGIIRALALSGPVMIGTTVGIGVGMGLAGTLLPVLIKERLPYRTVAGTVAYSTGIQVGATLSAAVAVPIALVFGGWRASLLIFSLATGLMAIGWIALTSGPTDRPLPKIAVSREDFRDAAGWALAAVFALYGILYYGVVAWLPETYIELGWSSTIAGDLIAVLSLGSIAGALAAGAVVDRSVSHRTALAAAGVGLAAAIVGFYAVPGWGIVWASLAGVTNGALFPMILAVPLRVTPSISRAAALTASMLGVGYSAAAAGPIGLGWLRDALGTFHAGWLALAVIAVVFAGSLVAVGQWRPPKTAS